MTTIDSIILIALGAGVITGFMKGFTRQLASILELIVRLLAAEALYTSLAVKLYPTVTDPMAVTQILAFIIIWITTSLISTSVALVLTRATEATLFGWLDHLLGTGLGVLRYPLLVGLVVCVIQFIDTGNQLINQTEKEESLLYYPMERLVGMSSPATKEVTQQYILEQK